MGISQCKSRKCSNYRQLRKAQAYISQTNNKETTKDLVRKKEVWSLYPGMDLCRDQLRELCRAGVCLSLNRHRQGANWFNSLNGPGINSSNPISLFYRGDE